jgi:hypothetical protein
MGELAAWRGRRRWVWVAAAGVVVVALVAYDGTVTATSVTPGKSRSSKIRTCGHVDACNMQTIDGRAWDS